MALETRAGTFFKTVSAVCGAPLRRRLNVVKARPTHVAYLRIRPGLPDGQHISRSTTLPMLVSFEWRCRLPVSHNRMVEVRP